MRLLSIGIRRARGRAERSLLQIVSKVDVIPNFTPPPRLLQSAALVQPKSALPSNTKSRLRSSGGLWGNGTAIFVVLPLAGALVWGVSFLTMKHRADSPIPTATDSAAEEPREHPVASRFASTKVPPLPQSEIDSLRVTSISLGQHPIAILNGRQVAEGEFFRLTTPRGTFPLRVEMISDGGVKLSHGEQAIRLKLQPLATPPRRTS